MDGFNADTIGKANVDVVKSVMTDLMIMAHVQYFTADVYQRDGRPDPSSMYNIVQQMSIRGMGYLPPHPCTALLSRCLSEG